MNYREITLRDVIHFKNGKKRPASEGNIPVYGGNGVLGYAGESNYEHCIIIGRVGAYCGSVYLEEGKCWVSDNAIAAVPTGGNDIRFFYYLLKGLRLNERHIGTSQPLLTQEILNKINCEVPSYPEQQRIAELLGSLDRKINVNQKLNDNLADLLQMIYQERFGNDILAVNQGVLSDICSYSRDKVAVSELNVRTYFSTENMLSGKAGSTEATSLPTTSQTTACHKGDTLISNIRPYFKKIVYCEDKCGCSTDVLCFTPSQPCYSAYLFSTLYADKFFAFMVAGSKGTKMPRGDKQQIMTYPVVLPSEEELAGFNTIASPLLEQIYSNRSENKRLSILRDTLLPKLMSGEIDVSTIQL